MLTSLIKVFNLLLILIIIILLFTPFIILNHTSYAGIINYSFGQRNKNSPKNNKNSLYAASGGQGVLLKNHPLDPRKTFY